MTSCHHYQKCNVEKWNVEKILMLLLLLLLLLLIIIPY